MRCVACNKNLNDFEATRKTDQGYVDLCNKCFKGLGIVAEVRADLNPLEEPPADWDELDQLVDSYDEANDGDEE